MSFTGCCIEGKCDHLKIVEYHSWKRNKPPHVEYYCQSPFVLLQGRKPFRLVSTNLGGECDDYYHTEE